MISADALKPNTKRWEDLGPISSGGTVFGIAMSPVADMPLYWIATGCGVYSSPDAGRTWAQTLVGLTTPLLSAMAVAANGALLAGSLGGDLFSSFDWGKTFQAAIVPAELKSTVTALLASPNFRTDGTAFAATDGGGLLVTRNSGKTWEDSSFGLGSTSVFAVASSPDWSQRETLFAATVDGVFVSTNGGRAWRETGLVTDDDTVDTLAVSPAFERDRTIYAGTELGRLYCSQNGGRSWDLLHEQVGEGPLNCLWLAPDFAESGHMVAAVAAKICLSDDGGRSWQEAAELPGPVLAMAYGAGALLAGLHDAGVYRSLDGGRSWESLSAGLAARGFARLVARAPQLYAIGPQEGLWASENGGNGWRMLPNLAAHYPLTAVALGAEGSLLVSSQQSGILRSGRGGEEWAVVLAEPQIQALDLAPAAGDGWAGTSTGKLFRTQDGGLSWSPVESPCEGDEILTIAHSPTYDQDHTVYLGSAQPQVADRPSRVVLWRSSDGGVSWRQVVTQVTDARWLDIAMPAGVAQNASEQAVLATGPFCLRPLRRVKDVWISTRVDPRGSNTLGVLVRGEVDSGGVLYAATGSGPFRSIDGGRTWQPFVEGMRPGSLISMSTVQAGDRMILYALGLGGALWAREME